jgi:hypothetical protein
LSQNVDIVLALRGARQFQSEAKDSAKSIDRVGDATERVGRKSKTATALTNGLHNSVSAIGRTAKIAASVGIGALASETVRATKGWADHLAITRRTGAVIKSTGVAAGVSARHVERLSDAVERQTGVDGDLVQGGANLLLTFTNIRNGVGKTNQIFDRATSTVTNMSKALGQDTKSSAVQLGKALNDPIKGITALSRVGVSFTEDQKKQIAALVKNGQTMKAQKIILGELAREFPRVQATPIERLQIQFRKLEDTLGAAVLPLFNRGVRILTRFLTEMNAGTGQGGRFVKFLEDVRNRLILAYPQVERFVRTFNWRDAAAQVKNLAGPLGALFDRLRPALGDPRVQKAGVTILGLAAAFKVVNKATGGAVSSGFKFGLTAMQMTTAMIGLVANLIAYKTARVATTIAEDAGTVAATRGRVATIASGIASKAAAAATWLWTIAQRALNLALTMNPIGLVVIAIVALVAGLILAYKKVTWFRNAVNAAFEWIKTAAGNVLDFFKANWPLIVSILGGPIVAVTVLIIRHFKQIVAFVKSMPGRIASAATGMWDGIKTAFKDAINWVIAKWNNLSFGMSAKKVAGHTVIPGFHVSTPNIPLLAKGGHVSSGGSAIVGDAGPEMVTLPPAATVTPLSARPSLDPAPQLQTIITKVYLDRRQIAEAVGGFNADKAARR